jgi:hypothetical protein
MRRMDDLLGVIVKNPKKALEEYEIDRMRSEGIIHGIIPSALRQRMYLYSCRTVEII